MDRIDNAILMALQNDGRLSNKELSSQVGLAPSSCLERVRKLQNQGIISGFQARINPKALGIGLQAFVAVRLSTHSREVVEAFRNHIMNLPEVIAIYHVAGQEDFMVHVGVKDAEHLRNLTLDSFTTRREVSRLNTSLVYEHLHQARLPNYRVDDN
jgi:DNA-binding Lrp family transcriptional regulator